MVKHHKNVFSFVKISWIAGFCFSSELWRFGANRQDYFLRGVNLLEIGF
jgi:hypothetical protein